MVASVALVLVLAPAAAAQKKKKAMPRGTPVIWRARDVSRLGVAAGAAGGAMRAGAGWLGFLAAGMEGAKKA